LYHAADQAPCFRPCRRNLDIYDFGRWDFHAQGYERWSINFFVFNSSDYRGPIEDHNDEVRAGVLGWHWQLSCCCIDETPAAK
jgi:hypothetical protein